LPPSSLARSFEAGSFLVSPTRHGETTVIVTAGRDQARLAQFAAALREDGFAVIDRWAPGEIAVHEPGPEYDAAVAGEIAEICRGGYDEHVRVQGPAGSKLTERPGAGRAGFTVEREGHLYEVTVVPRGRAGC
jgi:hypothetical protein